MCGSFDSTHQGSGGNVMIPAQGGSILGTPKMQPVTIVPYQMVTKAQMQECRSKGLCYFCEENWHQGHKCVKQKFYLLEGMDLPGRSGNIDSDTEQDQKADTGEE